MFGFLAALFFFQISLYILWCIYKLSLYWLKTQMHSFFAAVIFLFFKFHSFSLFFFFTYLPSFFLSFPPSLIPSYLLPSLPPSPPVYISLLYTSLTISHSWQLCDVVDRLLHKKSGFRSLFLTNLDSAFQLYYVRKKNSHFWKNVCKLTDNILKTEY